MKKTMGGVVVAMLLLVGCAHQTKAVVTESNAPYTIGREDVLDVAVWRDADLSRTLPVRPDGFISMPMIGDLQADGRTPSQLAGDIAAKLKPFVSDPKVTVIVKEVNSSRVFLTGEVAHPGAYPLRGKVSLIQAVALAGGFTDFANSDGILVIRQGQNGGKYNVRYSDLIAGDDTRTDFILRPGDTVVIP